MQSRGKLCRGESVRSSGSNCPDPFPAAMRGPLARYSTVASIIRNYNNKCKSEIMTQEPGNKVSPGAHSIRVRDLLVSVLEMIVQTNSIEHKFFDFRDMPRIAFDKINIALRSQ